MKSSELLKKGHAARLVEVNTQILLARLTPAERAVAQHVSRGLQNKEVAYQLHKSVTTVKQQMRSILAKTGLPNRGRLIALLANRHDT